jgi:proline dehydrogenase
MQNPRTGSPALVDLVRLRRASAYGAGRGLDQAMETCRRLADYGIASIVGYSAMPGEAPRSVADVHRGAFDRVVAEGLDCYVSVKLNGIGFDPALFGELALEAARVDRRLHLDALEPETADKTMQLLAKTPCPRPLGTTLPGRWRRSVEDGAQAMAQGLYLRIVKGHWTDERRGSVDPAEGFLRIIDLVAGHAGGVGVATHNTALLQESLRRLRAGKTPCEVELYLGMPFRGPAKIAADFGVPVRVYVPFGDAWPGYGIPDLITHPATVRWLVQDLLWGRDKTWRSIRRSRPGR